MNEGSARAHSRVPATCADAGPVVTGPAPWDVSDVIRSALVFAFAAAVALTGVALPASAQAESIQPPETAGLSLSADGRTRLHLALDAGLGFDTNPYTTPAETDRFSGDLTARIRPAVEVNVPGSLVAFTGKGRIDYGFLPGIVDASTRNFLLYQSAVSADFEVNRGAMFNFAAGDAVSWHNDPGIAVVGTSLNRVDNLLRAGVGWTPGGGALNLRLGYAFGFLKYLDLEQKKGIISQGQLDTMNHTLHLRTDYRFFPKTGVFTVLHGGFQNYPFTITQGYAFPVGLSIGVQGNVLPKLAGLASLGYSNPLVLDPRGALLTGSLFAAVGQLELQYAPTATLSLSGGFQRKFDPIALYGFVGTNRFYGNFTQTLLGRFALNMNIGYSVLQFGTEQSSIVLTDTPEGRMDSHLDGAVEIKYYVFDRLSFGVSNTTAWRTTNANDVTGLNLGYLRNETLLLASLRY